MNRKNDVASAVWFMYCTKLQCLYIKSCDATIQSDIVVVFAIVLLIDR